MKFFKTSIVVLCCMFAIVLFGCENKNISSLSTPTNLTVENGIIMFNLVNDADYYAISINDKVFMVDAKYNSNVQIIDSVVQYNANKILTYGKSYSIKIKARGNNKYDSHYSNIVEYFHRVSLQTPKNVNISANTLMWDNVDDASSYVVKVFYSTGNKTKEINCDVCFCDIQSVLNEYGTGKYLFSVKAVRNGNQPAESIFSEQYEYIHYQKLTTPTISNVFMSGANLKMTATLDINANKITIICDNDVKNVMLNGSNSNVSRSGGNVTINLTGIFGLNKFIAQKKYVFTLQAKYESVATSYFQNSNESEQFIYNKTEKLATPTISLNYNQLYKSYVVSWIDVENAVGYKLIVDNNTEYIIEQGATEFVIGGEFNSAKLQALGGGNYLNSEFSNIVSK